MARFEIVRAKVMCGDGEQRTYEIIKDRSTFARANLPQGGGEVTMGNGFIRCQGKRYVGTFGQWQPVYAGDESDVYYAGMSYFDGEWAHDGPGPRGTYSHVAAGSGTGKLFEELEQFSAANDVEARY